MKEQMFHPSHFALDRFIAKMHDENNTSPIKAHIESCPRCALLVENMQADYQDFLKQYPNEKTLANASQAIKATKSEDKKPHIFGSLVFKLYVASSAVIAAFIVVVSLKAVDVATPKTTQLTTRIKGSSSMEIAVSRNGESFLYTDQSLLPGDILVFRYSTKKHYLLMVSIEQSGKTNMFYTENQKSLSITPGQKIRLDRGIQLDEYHGQERIIVLFTDEPLDVEDVKAAVLNRFSNLSPKQHNTLSIGTLPFECDQLTWLINKAR